MPAMHAVCRAGWCAGVCLCLCMRVSVSVSVCMRVSVCVCVCVCVCQYVCMSVCISVCQLVHVYGCVLCQSASYMHVSIVQDIKNVRNLKFPSIFCCSNIAIWDMFGSL